MSKQNPAQEVLLNIIADCVAVLSMQLKRESGEWVVDNDRALEAWQGALERGIATLRKHNHDVNAADRYAAPVETVVAPATSRDWSYPDDGIRVSLPRGIESVVQYTIPDMLREVPMYRSRYVEPRRNEPNIQNMPGEVSFDAAEALLNRLTNASWREES